MMPKQKHSKRWQWILLTSFAALILVVYFGFALFFMSHFAFNTTVNGVSVAFQSPEKVNEYLASEISDYTLQLEAREDQSAIIRGREIDLMYVADGQMEDNLAKQQAWAWPLSLVPGNAYSIQHVNVQFNEQKLARVLDGLAILDKEQMRKTSIFVPRYLRMIPPLLQIGIASITMFPFRLSIP